MRLFATAALIITLFLMPAPASAFDLTVVHLNDTHSYLDTSSDSLKPGGDKTYVKLGGWARLTTAIKDIRASRDNVALLHAGDAVQGGLYFMKYDGKPEIAFMNRLKFDAMTLGNHEFDRGADFLADLLGLARFPVLSANIETKEKPNLGARVKPYTILTYGTEQVGIIGLTATDTQYTSVGGNEVQFEDEFDAAQKYIAELEAKGINKIIMLTHMGYERDKKLAADVSGVDLIVGGHTHTLLGNAQAMGNLGKSVQGPYPTVVQGPEGNDVYVVTGWKWGRVLPSLDLTFDASGRVTSAKGADPLVLADTFKRKDAEGAKVELAGDQRSKLLALLKKNPAAEVINPDAAAAEFLAPYTEGLDALQNEILGSASAPLPHMRIPTREHPEGSTLAPLVADSMLWVMATSTGRSADMALVNAGGVRDSLVEGPISVADALSLMPFGNTIYSLILSGAQIKLTLEHGVNNDDGSFPYVGGARYEADMTKPGGERVTKIEMLGTDGTLQPLDPNNTYRVVTNSFLANGGDGYAMLPSMITPDSDTGFVDSQVFMDFVKEKKTLTPPASTGVMVKW